MFFFSIKSKVIKISSKNEETVLDETRFFVIFHQKNIQCFFLTHNCTKIYWTDYAVWYKNVSGRLREVARIMSLNIFFINIFLFLFTGASVISRILLTLKYR